MKKLFLAALIPATMFLQGCDDETRAAGIGFAAGAIIGSQYERHHGNNRCYSGYRNQCRTRYNYYGHKYRECRRVYSGCARYYMEATGLELKASKAVTLREADLADKYGMSFEAAQKVVSAFDTGSKQNFSAFAAIGVTRDEMQDIYEGRMIPRRNIEQMSKALDLNPAATHAMLHDVVLKVQQEKARQGY